MNNINKRGNNLIRKECGVMARSNRICYEGATYHIYERGNNKQEIFLEDEDKECFLGLLRRQKERYDFKLYCYVLMDNHFHLLINTPMNNISQIMHDIKANYAKFFNNKYNRINHLFHDRFKSKIVDRDEYIIILSKYLHNNPVRANIVKTADEYIWSSIKYFTKEIKDKHFIDRDIILNKFSDNIECAKERYRTFMKINNDEKYYPDLNNYIGSKETEKSI